MRRKKLLALEPYCGGSHRSFLEGMARKADFAIDIISLPAHSWKWRMRFAAPFFVRKMPKTASYDCVLCSSMLDIAALRGLGPAWLKGTRLVTYFHENQFAYPVRKSDTRDLHFAVTNLTSAIASDSVLFNSAFNRRSFLAGSEEILRKIPDMTGAVDLTELEVKSAVLAPGFDFDGLDVAARNALPAVGGAPLLIWNHRWEHDKNPDLFFENLFSLQKLKVPFKVAILGQSFRDVPEIFNTARKRLQRRIVHFGYAPPEIYAGWLQAGSVVVSTALHEFFGMAVVEAARAGCRPLLPNRLSYPELFNGSFLYNDEEFSEALVQALEQGRLAPEIAAELTQSFSWESLLPEYERVFFG